MYAADRRRAALPRIRRLHAQPGGPAAAIPLPPVPDQGKVIAVIGATGERDPGKRRPPGTTAGLFADTVIVTHESPFSESATALRRVIATGARAARHAEVIVQPGRADAFALATTLARPGDVVVATGRGHDPRQMFGATTQPFDDRDELRRALQHSTLQRSR